MWRFPRPTVLSKGFIVNRRKCQFSTRSSSKPFDRVLVANRGEIAERIFRTCHKLGVETVAVTSTVDNNAPFAQMATESLCLGPPAASESYLHMDRVLEAMEITGAQALHPGYGFLSENSTMAQKVLDAGYVWLGPPPDVVATMGDKLASKEAALAAGMMTVPGTDGVVSSLDEALQMAETIEYPVLLKALAGGGGKGMRICRTAKDLKDAWDVSKAEALQFFSNDALLLEKYIDQPHHIEFQVLCSPENVLVFPERECSIQRRNQKIIEESPSVLLTPETREKMAQQVKKLCEQTGYLSAGTVEFLVDENQNVFFLEMNSRLQVEHPVTEAITGVDLVEGMLYIGAGWDLPAEFQTDSLVVPHQGHAVEARVYAEDPTRGFVPSTGALSPYVEPVSARVDSGVRAGHHVTAHYDPMLSKVVAHGETRDDAIVQLGQALDEYVIEGVQHNARLVRSILREPYFQRGETPTTYLELHYPNMRDQLTLLDLQLSVSEAQELAAIAALVHRSRSKTRDEPPLAGVAPNEPHALIIRLEGLFGPGYECEFNGDGTVSIKALDADETVPQRTIQVDDFELIPKRYCATVTMDGTQRTVQVIDETMVGEVLMQMYGAQVWVMVQSHREFELTAHMQEPVETDEGLNAVRSPMPGTLVRYSVGEGDYVEIGQELCVVEAMKMQNQITSPRAGIIGQCMLVEGDSLMADQVLLEFAVDEMEESA